MPHTDPLYQWTDRVQQLFPDLKPHHSRTLALYSFGCALARTCGLAQVVTYLAGFLALGAATIRQRLRELYQPSHVQRGCARSTFDHTLCFGPLIRWAASAQKDKQLLLALDPTCLADRFRVLAISVLYRGGGLPVAWAVQTARQKGSWNALWKDLLGQLHKALGEGWTVLVLTDRGLESAALFRAIVALGWHPLMRVKAGGKFQPSGWHKGHRFEQFASAVGRRWAGEGQAYPTGERLACTLLAAWDEGHEDPWLLLTDLPAASANPACYAFRMWIEQCFKVIKSGCWQWQHTRMTDPDRAARLWAVLAAATLWMVEMGDGWEALEVSEIKTKKRSQRLVSLGLWVLLLTLWTGAALPKTRMRPQPDWPQRQWEPDELTEAMMDQS